MSTPLASELRRIPPHRHRVVVVGGGAGGLELAARLGDLNQDERMEVLLVDAALTHVWKPLLHELAAGTLRAPQSEVDYLEQARRHGFLFHPGELAAMERAQHLIWLAPLVDEDGEEIAPRRALAYDTAVIAVGSVVNDFGTPGVARHAMRLDDAAQARLFHRRLLAACARAEMTGEGPVDVVVVGGGATGVELVAELHEATLEIARYGARLARLAQPVRLHLIEAAPRLLAAQPEAVARQALDDLRARGIEVLLDRTVVAVQADAVQVKAVRPAGNPGAADAEADAVQAVPAHLVVWAAGIRGPAVLQHLDGLELHRAGQLVVRPTLQTTRDDDVFAIGDCAVLLNDAGRSTVPAVAQAARQEAKLLAPALYRRLRGQPLPHFRFHDHGSLVSLGRTDATGRLVGASPRQGVTLTGWWARWAYWALQRQHMVTLHGVLRTVLATLGGWLVKRAQPRVKLH